MRGKSCARADSEFPDAVAQLRCDRSVDLTRARALSLAVSGNSRSDASAEVVPAVSLYDDSLSDRRVWYAAESVPPPILENQRDCFAEIRTGLVRGSPLTVCPRNFRRVRDEPLFISLDDRSELVMHGRSILPRCPHVDLGQLSQCRCGARASSFGQAVRQMTTGYLSNHASAVTTCRSCCQRKTCVSRSNLIHLRTTRGRLPEEDHRNRQERRTHPLRGR